MEKIILIIPTLTSGGAERVITELANEFIRNQKNIHVVTLVRSDDFYVLHPNVKIHRLEYHNNGKIRKIALKIKTFIRLRKLLKKEKPESVLSFTETFNVFTILASRFLRLKVFISDRSSPNTKHSIQISILRKLTYRFATGIIAQTALAKEILQKTTSNKNIEVIPNPVKIIHVSSNIKREKIILTVGRLIPLKGHKYLLEAFKKLNVLDWQLVIIGEGFLHDELLRQAGQLGIANQVLMPGAVNNVDEWLCKSSLFAFTSISEGFPNALAEAMAAGLPCICFDCDTGPKDMIHNGVNGILVDLLDVEKFSNQLQVLVNNPELRYSLGMEAAKIKSELDISKIANKYLTFILK